VQRHLPGLADGVVPNAGQRKGGNLTGLTLGAEVRHQVAKGAVAVAERRSDFEQRPVLQEDGAESFVATVERLGGLAEEVGAGGIVHRNLGDGHRFGESDRPRWYG
jgi:hypothetical protein